LKGLILTTCPGLVKMALCGLTMAQETLVWTDATMFAMAETAREQAQRKA